MKAITIWQPWASLLACGAKKYETRSWPTSYRGPIAIHAALKDPCKLPLTGKGTFEGYIQQEMDAERCPPWCFMPRGAVIATAELVDVWHITSINPIQEWLNGAVFLRNGEEVLAVLEKAEEQKNTKGVRNLYHLATSKKEIALGDWTPGRYAWQIENVQPLPEPIPAKGKQGLWNWAERQQP